MLLTKNVHDATSSGNLRSHVLDKDLLKISNFTPLPIDTAITSYVEIRSSQNTTKNSEGRSQKKAFQRDTFDYNYKKETYDEIFAQSLNVLISPSEYLAEQAIQHKLPKPRVIRHGFSKQNANHKKALALYF